MTKVLLCAARGLNKNLHLVFFGGVENCLAANVIQRAINNVVELEVVTVHHVKHTDASIFNADGYHAALLVYGNHSAVFIAVSWHIKFLLMLVKRPPDLGGLVGECCTTLEKEISGLILTRFLRLAQCGVVL